VPPALVQLLIAAAIPTVGALLAQWRQAAVNTRRHEENAKRLERIEAAISGGPDGFFITRREFQIHADADSERFDSINSQLLEIRHLLERR
jgi:hypothetical protein